MKSGGVQAVKMLRAGYALTARLWSFPMPVVNQPKRLLAEARDKAAALLKLDAAAHALSKKRLRADATWLFGASSHRDVIATQRFAGSVRTRPPRWHSVCLRQRHRHLPEESW